MAKVLQRPGDLLARYGGEEFAVILPDTDRDGAMRVADNLRREVEALAIEHAGSDSRQVTISAGVSWAVVDRDAIEPLLLREADTALYEAKRDGRNRVVAAFGQRPRLAIA
jgi:diguanylate cyclase (GGDEF)-like protein